MIRNIAICLFAVLAGLNALAGTKEITVNFSAQGFANAQKPESLTVDGLNMTFHSGGRSSSPQYYTTYKGLVFYGINYMDIEAPEGMGIERIEMTHAEKVPLEQDRAASSCGVITLGENFTATWTNNRPVRYLTVTPRAGGIDHGSCICSMKFYLADTPSEANPIPPTPSVSPQGGQIFPDTHISLSTPEPGATIYYTIDGSIPSPGAGGTREYTAPFALERTSVIQAISVMDGMEVSNVGGRGFVIPISASSIAELLGMAQQGVYYTLVNPVTVTYRLGSTCWIEDQTGALSLFGDAITGKKPASGNLLATVTGKYNTNNMNPELEYVNADRFTPISTGQAATPLDITVGDLEPDMINRYILIRHARLTDLGNYDYTLTDASGSVTVRNNYRIAIESDWLADEVDVELFPAVYYNTTRYYIASVRPTNYVEPDPEPEPEKPADGRTAATAWSVSQALALGEENFSSNVWVKGYIVGSYPEPANMFATPTFGIAGASNHGIVIADTKDCTDPDKVIRLINMQGAVKTELNLADNPDRLYTYIAAMGMLGSNYKTLMMPQLYQFLDEPLASIKLPVPDAEGIDPNAEYYTLQGIKVNPAHLMQGTIYICRRNGTVTKFVR